MIATNSLLIQESASEALGRFLRDRRAKLDPASFGFSSVRRRTPGLRREEVAQRANISSAWYVCLEQGRGGAPSADVLENLAKALLLTDAEREHLFLIGLGRAPESHYRHHEDIEPRLQRILDRLSPAPAFIKTATWDVVAWNQAATVLWPNLEQIAAEERNTLRMVFLDPHAKALYYDWEAVARMAVAAFRADVARVGAMAEVAALVDELSRSSPTFKAMWQQNDVSDSAHAGEGLAASGSWNNHLRMLFLRGGRTAGPHDDHLPAGQYRGREAHHWSAWDSETSRINRPLPKSTVCGSTGAMLAAQFVYLPSGGPSI